MIYKIFVKNNKHNSRNIKYKNKTISFQNTINKVIVNILLISFLINFFVPNSYAKSLNSNEVRAISAILIDQKTGKVLWEKNSREKRAMASTTKLMTAILAIEKGNLSDIVTTSKYAASMPETKMGLVEGEEHTLENLLYALLLESANDSAVAIAEHIGGSVQDFSEMMNQKAKEIGSFDTNFVTPNGLDDSTKEHYSTAYDMARIMRYILNNDKIIEIMKTKSNEIMSTNLNKKYIITNTNRLLDMYQETIGGKTGFTSKAGHCFVGAIKLEDYTLISVVLASGWGKIGKEGKWTDTKKILDYGINEFILKTVISENQKIYKDFEIYDCYSDEKYVDLFSTKEISIPTIKDRIIDNVNLEIKFINKYKTKNLKENNDLIPRNTILAKANVYIGNEYIDSIDLVCKKDIRIISYKNSIFKLLEVFKYQFL